MSPSATGNQIDIKSKDLSFCWPPCIETGAFVSLCQHSNDAVTTHGSFGTVVNDTGF